MPSCWFPTISPIQPCFLVSPNTLTGTKSETRRFGAKRWTIHAACLLIQEDLDYFPQLKICTFASQILISWGGAQCHSDSQASLNLGESRHSPYQEIRIIKEPNMAVRLIRSGRNRGRYVIDWRDEYKVRHSYMHGYSKRSADNFWHKQMTLRAERRTLDRKPHFGRA